MKRIFTVLIIVCLFMQLTFGAKKPLLYWGIAANNFVAAKPISGFSKMFYSQFHPGLTVSTGFNWKEKPKHNLMQSFKAGYFSHRFIQRSIMLYTEFGYRYKAGNNLGLSIAFGGGYLHMIPATQQFKMNDDGTWDQVKLKSRPQGMISLSMGIDYKINAAGWRTFIRYQNMLQTPFVPGYIPLLPYNVLHVGVTVPMSAFKKGGNNAK